jgi:hypothetical protein
MMRSGRLLHEALLAAALLWIAAPLPDAGAVPIQLTVTGAVTTVSPVLASVFSPGQSMTATFTYDSDTPGVTSLVSRVTYPGALTGGSFTIGAHVGTSVGGTINVANDDPTFNDRLDFSNVGIAASSVGTHDPFLFRITLEDAAQLALTTTDLPVSLPPLSAFTDRSWILAFTPIALAPFEQTGVSGRLLSATFTPLAVPEPSVIVLLLLAAAMWTLVLSRVKFSAT